MEIDSKLDFAFVDDSRLRSVLLEYYAQTQNAFTAGGYLGVVVGSGSIVEGILTWALLKREKDAMTSGKACKDKQGAVKALDVWNLTNLIDVAFELGLIGQAAKQASWALKDFRNFIHPYNLLKQSARPDQALAMSALGSVGVITESLRKRVPPKNM